MTVPDIPGINEGTLPRFDYQNLTERKMALMYRQHEVGRVLFVIFNVPRLFTGAVHDCECARDLGGC